MYIIVSNSTVCGGKTYLNFIPQLSNKLGVLDLVNNQRRKLLTLTGATLTTGLAGCGGSDDNSTETGGTSSENGNTDEEAVIKFLSQTDVETIPIVTDVTAENSAEIKIEAEDRDGLDRVQLQYTDTHRDQPLTISGKDKSEFENSENRETVSISEDFPQTAIAPNTGEFQVNVTDVNGNETTQTKEINGLSNFRADRRRTESGIVGNYETPRNWDNIVLNEQSLNQKQQRALQEQAYTELVDKIMEGDDFTEGNIYPNWQSDDRGFFDQDAVKNADNFERLIRWYLPAIQDHDRYNYGSAPSSRNDRFAATMETLINEHHPSAEAVSTSVKSLPSHGIFGVHDRDGKQFYMVDTTASPVFDQAVAQVGENFITSENGNRSELWEPFHDFKPGTVETAPNYEGKKIYSMASMLNFVTKGAILNKEREDGVVQLFMTDEWMEDGFEVLRNGGSTRPIEQPIEEGLSDDIYDIGTKIGDQEIYVGIYGDLDDTRMLITENEELYNTVMFDQYTTPGIEEIEEMVEAL